MRKLDSAIKKEIIHMAAALAVSCALICVVFLVIKKFSMGVLVGAAMGCLITLIGFIWLGFSVQKAVEKGDKAKLYLQTTYYGRMLLYGAWVVGAAKCPFLNTIAAAIPVLLPTVLIKIMQALGISKDDSPKSKEETKE